MKARVKWLLLAALALATGVAIGMWTRPPTWGRFDATVWQDETRVRDRVRLEMADDLVARQMFSGPTRAQVVGMLGEPPPTEYFRS